MARPAEVNWPLGAPPLPPVRTLCGHVTSALPILEIRTPISGDFPMERAGLEPATPQLANSVERWSQWVGGGQTREDRPTSPLRRGGGSRCWSA